MRRYSDVSDFRPSIIGTLAVSGATALGAPIDTLGFADVLATVIAGAGIGTGGNGVILTVKFQESASPTGTGASWTDITNLNGGVDGSFKFNDITILDVTDPAMRMDAKYGKLMKVDTNRQRYIRCHASILGTGGFGIKYSVGLLLGRPNSTLWLSAPTSQATGNSQFSILR